ncbi:MAG TPA: putative baseplate assembly protein [Pyrinomonadaceae bacterium]|nr:putative baseplate assembly protein [Pyrinomonadaceae bacterium]
MIYFCCDDERRRNAVKAHPTLNGIDFIEVDDDHDAPFAARQRKLFVHFIEKETAPGRQSLANLLANLRVENVRIEGGERIKDVAVIRISTAISASPPASPPVADNVLIVEVSKPGDFSTYILRFIKDLKTAEPPAGLDPGLSAVAFSFKVACETHFDCKTPRVCLDGPKQQPEIDYLAKDYSSFRRLLLDRLAVLAPQWTERNPADLGIALVELLAYVGDYLSYQQDAVATESYLGTARKRASVRRHARLVDYPMHDGRNARVWVQVGVAANNVILPKGTQLLTRIRGLGTRIKPASGSPPLPSAELEQALNARPIVFETMAKAMLHQANNEMHFYTWGNDRCCLPKGATRATLKQSNELGLVNLQPGDVLIFIEKRNPDSGLEEEANPANRHAVRLTEVKTGTDPLFKEPASSQDMRVVDIEWSAADALPFALCLWDVSVAGNALQREPVSIALGNIVLADHGQTIKDESLPPVPESIPALAKVKPASANACQQQAIVPTAPRYRPQLKQTPITQRAPYDPEKLPASATATTDLPINDPLRLPLPAVTLSEPGEEGHWEARRDLLASGPGDKAFVVETETDSTAYLRFGDGQLGLRPASGTTLLSTYRVGNGTAGNIGANALAHIVTLEAIKEGIVTNFLPAVGGINPETIEEVRQRAPSAFRKQERAVTAADYQEIATRKEVAQSCGLDVQRAAATQRWTGSWYTTFLTIDRLKGKDVDADFEFRLRNCMERFRMAGEDLEVDGPHQVPLEIVLGICVKPGYFFSDVERALLEIFSNRVLPDGRLGVFHPDNFSFGQAVYVSPLVATAQSVTGVESVNVKKFQRQGIDSDEALVGDKLTLGRLEIAQLENDRNFPERGVFTIERG